MIRISELLSEIMTKTASANLNESQSIIYEEVQLFQELANPDFAYLYDEVKPNEWEFQDKFSNTIGVRFDTSTTYFESYYIVKDLQGNLVRIYDYEKNKPYIDPTSFTGNSDENRSDTICKILRDEVLPKYLVNKRYSTIKLHPLNDYRYQIFMKCAEICQEKYPQIEIKPMGKEIHLINR